LLVRAALAADVQSAHASVFRTWRSQTFIRKDGIRNGRQARHCPRLAAAAAARRPWVALLLVALGYLSDYLLARRGRLRISRSLLIGVTQLLAALAVIPVGFTDSLPVAIACITAAVAFSMGANAAYYAVNVDIAPSRAATALGIMDTGFAISGFLAPAITGWVVGTFGSFQYAFLLMGGLALSSVLVVLLFHRPDEDRADEPQGDQPALSAAAE